MGWDDSRVDFLFREPLHAQAVHVQAGWALRITWAVAPGVVCCGLLVGINCEPELELDGA